ncbi:MAG: dienelactone hydrolase-related enzyme, partial [Myxococcota bacterium]
MYLSWLDRWDERRVQRGNALKAPSKLILDADRAFPGANANASLTDFCVLAEQSLEDSRFFERPAASPLDFERLDDYLTFPSDIQTDVVENNVVWARVTESGRLDHALIVFHHWNAQKH